jgi:hypothetical protein
VGVDAEYRPLVRRFRQEQSPRTPRSLPDNAIGGDTMGRGLLLWMLGVPIPVIILLWLFFGR